MRFFLAFLAFFASTANCSVFGQLQTQFPDSQHVVGYASAFEVVGYALVVNTSANDALVRWVRIENNIPSVWKTAICDRNFCHFSTVDSAEVLLLAGDSTNIDLHFYPNYNAGVGQSKVLVFDVNNPSDHLVFNFTANVLPDTTVVPNPPDTTGIIKKEVLLYPNPVYANSQAVKLDVPIEFAPSTLIISTTDGRIMANYRINTSGIQNLDLGNYTDGYYVLLLLADSGIEYHSKIFIKRKN